MRAWLKGGLIGLIIGIFIVLLPYLNYILYYFNLPFGLPYIPFPFRTISIILLIIIFSFGGYVLEKLKDESISITKKGFLVGLFFGLITISIGFLYIFYLIRFGGEKDYRYYEALYRTIVFLILSIVECSLVGFISQKIKNKSPNWPNWGYTKKGFIIGLITGLIVFISLIVYIVWWMYKFNKGIIDAFGGYARMWNSFFVFILIVISPIIVLTIIGLIIGKLKNRNQGVKEK